MRPTRIGRNVRAGCEQCHGGQAHWFAKNAQGVAARHHDATGHEVWVEVEMHITYGVRAEPKSMPLPFESSDEVSVASFVRKENEVPVLPGGPRLRAVKGSQ